MNDRAQAPSMAVGEAMAEAASRLLELLDDGQRRRAVSGFPGEPERSRWFYVPTEHGGLTLTECTPLQRQARHAAAEQALGPGAIQALSWSPSPAGLPWPRLRPGQREILTALLDGYLGRLPDEGAEAERAKITGPAAEHLHFAWAGSTEPRQPHYYRIQGPRLLVEYDNTERDANHIHTVWRDPAGDFGHDPLADHYARHH